MDGRILSLTYFVTPLERRNRYLVQTKQLLTVFVTQFSVRTFRSLRNVLRPSAPNTNSRFHDGEI
jgi:hypothetical protein